MRSKKQISLTRETAWSFNKFVATSIIVHISLFALFLITTKKTTSPQVQIVEITFDDLNNKKKQININPNLIVETDSSAANNTLSETAKFLSEKSNAVKKQTRAKFADKFHNATKNSKELKEQKKQNKSLQPQLFESGFDAYAALNKRDLTEQKQQKGSKSTDASTTNDNLMNIEQDLITRLNTKEYKYYGYYNRIKKQLNQWWVPKVQQKFTKLLRQRRVIASEQNKVTKLVITLNDVGNLVRVQVLAESGIRDLDDAAIEAFRQAAPFPNPPKGMIERDGTVKIRWDCVVEG